MPTAIAEVRPVDTVNVAQSESGNADSPFLLPEPDPLKGTGIVLWIFRINVFVALLAAAYLGGPVVRTGAIAAMVFAAVADRAGAVRHVLHLAWLALSGFVLGYATVPVGTWLSSSVGLPTPLAMVLGVALILLAGLLGTGTIGALITHQFRRSRYLYVLNHAGGSMLGIAEGALLVVVISWLLAVFGPTIWLHAEALADRYPPISNALHTVASARMAFRDDPVGAWLDEKNPLPDVPEVMTIAALGELSAEPGLFWKIVDDGGLRELLEIPVVREHFERIKSDEHIRKAIDKRDIQALMRSRHLTDALADDELCEAIADRWPDIRAGISDTQIAKAHRVAGDLKGEARSQYRRALRRAKEFGIEVP